MPITFIHLSDLHFRLNWEEDQELVLNMFFKDLKKQIQDFKTEDIYLIFSGDIVLAGGNHALYESFFNTFNLALNSLNIPFEKRICIPGNHDVSVDYIKTCFREHEGIIVQNLKEKEFNDYIGLKPALFTKKFENYGIFEQKFAKFGIQENILSGNGFDINNVGVYCLNTAVFSSGGYEGINDEKKLAIDTRDLYKWVLNNESKIKILVMHHPLNWLNEWSQNELTKILKGNFNLVLSGHLHSHSMFYSINGELKLIECSAPPLLTNKHGNLGYAIISVSEHSIQYIKYRQWTKNNTFLSGVDFSNTENGIVVFEDTNNKISESTNDVVEFVLNKKLMDALQSFSGQPIIWVDPIISTTNELATNTDENDNSIVDINNIISGNESSIITGPPQFGLTCLAHYLIKEAYVKTKAFWIYLDASSMKINSIQKFVNKELELFKVSVESVKCIVLDTYTNDIQNLKLLKAICDAYPDIPIIVMQTIDDSKFLDESDVDFSVNRTFRDLYLLPLPRGKVRKIISDYNKVKYIGEDSKVLTKITSDLEVLNVHRTPLNCLTLLKVSEKYFDESPVNRTKMIEMVLFVLFNMDNVPTYKAKPDLKDCEFVLGIFCEQMIRNNEYIFSRDIFLRDLKGFCAERLIDLEVDVVFDVLKFNNIIVIKDSLFTFRSSYWVLYFAAIRMHQDVDFANFIIREKKYVSYPEIIEFYTGIDRRREDALKILTNDLKETCDIVNLRVGLPDDMNPYRLIKWDPSQEAILKMQNEIGDSVISSGLPEAIKDQYADLSYDQTRPFDQSIKTIFSEYSLWNLMQCVKASCRALRNSDYVNPNVKRELLFEIIRAWEQVSKVLMALTPILASEGRAAFEGTSFELLGSFGDTFEERMSRILQVNPVNVVSFFKSDLFSDKIGPLLYDQIAGEKNELKKHELILLLIYERPREWKKHVQEYIIDLSKNSFYLYSVVNTLRAQYRFSFASSSTLKDIEYLIKMGIAKHHFGEKKPGLDKIVKISNSQIPKRENEDRLF